MTRIHLFLCTLAVLFLSPAAALAADGAIADPSVAKVAGVVSLVVSLAGVVSRIVSKAAPLYRFLPIVVRWVPDAVSAAAGVLLLGLPTQNGTWLEFVEVCLIAVVMGAIAAAPGVHPTSQQ